MVVAGKFPSPSFSLRGLGLKAFLNSVSQQDTFLWMPVPDGKAGEARTSDIWLKWHHLYSTMSVYTDVDNMS